MLTLLHDTPEAKIYRLRQEGSFESRIATTKWTRMICNDPVIHGVRYTSYLQKACTQILKAEELPFDERSCVVVKILRGGLNFGLREALCDACDWNTHTTCFISAQRARYSSDPEEWHITENAYRKLYFPRKVSFVIGDVVATGTSLEYALNELIEAVRSAGSSLRNIIFFTYGGPKAEQLLKTAHQRCRELFKDYEKTILYYLEGCFSVPDTNSPLTIRLTGTDLNRGGGSVTAPEFTESQYEDPAYPLERCIIYDAGSRAFWIREYATDVISYWKEVLSLAERGMTFTQYLAERYSVLSPERFGKEEPSLKELAIRQIERMKPFA